MYLKQQINRASGNQIAVSMYLIDWYGPPVCGGVPARRCMKQRIECFTLTGGSTLKGLANLQRGLLTARGQHRSTKAATPAGVPGDTPPRRKRKIWGFPNAGREWVTHSSLGRRGASILGPRAVEAGESDAPGRSRENRADGLQLPWSTSPTRAPLLRDPPRTTTLTKSGCTSAESGPHMSDRTASMTQGGPPPTPATPTTSAPSAWCPGSPRRCRVPAATHLRFFAPGG